MKKILWFIILVTIVGSFIYLYVDDKVAQQKMLTDIKTELDDLSDEDVLQIADDIIFDINSEREKKKILLDSLDSVLKLKNEKIRKSNQKLKDNEEKILFLEMEKLKIEEEREELIKIIEKNDSTLVEIKKSTKNLNEIYKKIAQEKKNLEEKYLELSSKYDGSKFIVVDSIYQIDTVFYKSEDVKKIKLRN
jgi:chromosome segregation ATPase